MTSEQRLIKVQLNITRMASLSTTVSKVLEICNNPASSPYDLNQVISLDPVLTGQVIKLINSAYYALVSRVTSLPRAIIILGVNTVKNLVLATSILSSFRTPTIDNWSADAYWAHSLCVGIISRMIAKMCQVPVMEREEFFMAGLLHDLGKLPMIACYEDLHHQAVRKAQAEKLPLHEAERHYFGFEHSQVGRLIAAKWKLDQKMRDAIAYHHAPFSYDQKPNPLLLYMSLANQVANRLDVGGAGDSFSDESLMKALANRIGLDLESLLSMKPLILEEIEKAKLFLGK